MLELKKANQAITKNDILAFEKRNGKIQKNSTLIFYTGWQSNLEKK